MTDHDNTLRRPVARHILAPDGSDHVVVLDGWFWESFDWLCSAGHCDKDETIAMLWGVVSSNIIEISDTSTRFYSVIEGYIDLKMRSLFPELNIGRPDNDNPV